MPKAFIITDPTTGKRFKIKQKPKVLQEQHPDIGIGSRFGLKGLVAEPARIASELRRQGFDVIDNRGQIAVRKPGESDYRVLDPRGADWQDLLDVVPDVGVAIAGVGGAVLGAPGGPIGAAGGSAGGAALASSAREALAAAAGYDVGDAGDVVKRVGIDAALGAGAELGGQALGAAWKAGKAGVGKAVSKLGPGEAAVGREAAREFTEHAAKRADRAIAAGKITPGERGQAIRQIASDSAEKHVLREPRIERGRTFIDHMRTSGAQGRALFRKRSDQSLRDMPFRTVPRVEPKSYAEIEAIFANLPESAVLRTLKAKDPKRYAKLLDEYQSRGIFGRGYLEADDLTELRRIAQDAIAESQEGFVKGKFGRGSGRAYDPKTKNLEWVLDRGAKRPKWRPPEVPTPGMAKGQIKYGPKGAAWKSIPLEGLQSIEHASGVFRPATPSVRQQLGAALSRGGALLSAPARTAQRALGVRGRVSRYGALGLGGAVAPQATGALLAADAVGRVISRVGRVFLRDHTMVENLLRNPKLPKALGSMLRNALELRKRHGHNAYQMAIRLLLASDEAREFFGREQVSK